MEYRVIWPDGTIRTVWAQPGEALRNASGEIVRLTGIVQDITGRKADEIRIQQQAQHLKLQVERLKALRAIDLMITANFDIRPTLIALLDQVIARLNVDAAAVLLFNEGLQTLDFAAGRGFRSRVIEQTRLLLGQGYAGRAGFERVTVVVPDLQAVRAGNARAPLLADEDCHAYCGVPLIAKGRLVGVLEIFQRTPLPEDPDWLEFLETLAGQAAIAIDNAHLFDDLQRTNAELRLAYDATIEGWSHAMDLRDRETEGHSRRVTDLTVRLAEAAGLGTEQITHARRGALLHDIGKLGIPDRILFKADTLTDDEWAVMRKHPQYAF
ncbi:MAG TPA: GAF domain-containing protein, partial [Anaerolineales bacterium]|nr:GAF domain-containing protein [Anaerolineales bacterium]